MSSLDTGYKLKLALEGIMDWSEWSEWADGYLDNWDEDIESLPSHVESFVDGVVTLRDFGKIYPVRVEDTDETFEKGNYIIFRLVDNEGNGHYFRKDGTYISHDGMYWDGEFYKVTPVVKPVTHWAYVK